MESSRTDDCGGKTPALYRRLHPSVAFPSLNYVHLNKYLFYYKIYKLGKENVLYS